MTSVVIGDGVEIIGYRAFNSPHLTDITFKDTSVWYYAESQDKIGGVQIDVTNPSANATYCKDTYRSYYWYKL